MVGGNASSELAKIGGITPPELTRSGKYEDCPPMTRRPTTRLAYCTGMRRCAPSTYTMKATTAIIRTTRKIRAMGVKGPQARVLAFSYKSCTARGRPTTMPVKMMSDIPLPMPRSLICSPSHMRSEEHTSELQSRLHLVCRLLLEKKKKKKKLHTQR